MISKDSKLDLQTNKVKFKLRTVSIGVNALHATDKDTESDKKEKPMKEMKMSDIDVGFQESFTNNSRVK